MTGCLASGRENKKKDGGSATAMIPSNKDSPPQFKPASYTSALSNAAPTLNRYGVLRTLGALSLIQARWR